MAPVTDNHIIISLRTLNTATLSTHLAPKPAQNTLNRV